jgi:hypothetical protein
MAEEKKNTPFLNLGLRRTIKTDSGKTAFREGFIAGWCECVGESEANKTKLKQIAEAAADRYLKDRRR